MPIESRASALSKQEVAELKAHHLACSHLVKGCQDAIITFREKARTAHGSRASRDQRAIEILEEVLGSWCDTLAVLRAALNQTSSTDSAYRERFELISGVFNSEFSRAGVPTTNMRRS